MNFFLLLLLFFLLLGLLERFFELFIGQAAYIKTKFGVS